MNTKARCTAPNRGGQFMTSRRIIHAAAAVAFVLGAAAAARAQATRVDGRVISVDWPYVTIDSNGHKITQKLHSSTRIVFHQGAESFPNPEIGDLKPGMSVHFDYNANK